MAYFPQRRPSLMILCVITITAFFIIPLSLSIPFVLFHGVNSQCSNPQPTKYTKLLSKWSNSNGYCLEIGNGTWTSWFMPMEEQVEEACNKVKSMKELKNGYNIVGLSQGNLIGRGLVQFCQGSPPVKNFISLGGPQAGVASVPECGSGELCIIADRLIRWEVYTEYVQAHLAPSGYMKLPNNIDGYLEHCKFLPKLNNEHANKNPIYKQRLTSLQNLVLIMFENDTVVIPKESSWFGYYPDGAFTPLLSAHQTKLYTEDWIGLKTLDDGGRLKFVRVAGAHIQISNADMRKYVVPYLKNKEPSSSTKEKVKTLISQTPAAHNTICI